MMRKFTARRKSWLILLMFFGIVQFTFAEGTGSIQLPVPDTQGGKPLMQALKERKSTREFSDKQLPVQVLSNLLWAAFGVNRPEEKKRTAPSGRNTQEIDIYVSMQSGLYLYNPFNNTLELILSQDIRGATGTQQFVKEAPVNLIFVADLSRAQDQFNIACDTGYISQNVYLYCASEGLATVARGLFNQAELAGAMKLKPNQKIELTQTVGYPKDAR